MQNGSHHDAQFERWERGAASGDIPAMVAMLRQQQRELDNLRLSLDVATRDREELRTALLHCRNEVLRLRSPHQGEEE